MPTQRKTPVLRARRPAALLEAQPLPAPVAPVVLPPAPLSLPRPAGLWQVAALLLGAAAPAVGLGLALLYMRQDDRSARSFGRWCLALAIVGWLLAALMGAVESALGNGEWFVQPYY